MSDDRLVTTGTEFGVTGISYLQLHRFGRFLLATLISMALILPQAVVPAAAASERAIYLYYTHTKETAHIVFKRNGPICSVRSERA